MEVASWSALPPRKKRSSEAHHSDNTVAHPPLARKVVSNHHQILANIEARKCVNHSITTLLSKDGCGGKFYEYLDHTADVQCHAWGYSLSHAFENIAQCMINYMTDLTLVCEDQEETVAITVKGHDMKSLLYNYMNEILFKFSSDGFCTSRAAITNFNETELSITANLYGDIFDPERHSSGTEIKAITYSNMQIHYSEPTQSASTDPIEHITASTPSVVAPTQDAIEAGTLTPTGIEHNSSCELGRVDLYVIVDI